MVSRFLEGAGMGVMGVAGASAIAPWFAPEKRGFPLGIWAMWVALAMCICPVLYGYVVDTLALPWQTVWSVSYTHLDVYKRQLVRGRQLDKDLLSTKKVLYRPCSELPEAMRAEVYDGYFEDLGTYEVLFLDDFEGFFDDPEMGPMMCKLLLGERLKRRLDTVITSTKPLSEYDLSDFGGMLGDFEEVTMEVLDDAGLEEYVRGLVEDYTEEGKSPVLAPEAIAYIAHDLGQTPTMIRKATHFLMTQYELSLIHI